MVVTQAPMRQLELVREAKIFDILGKRLDAKHGTVLLTATIVRGLLEKPLEFVQAPALVWIQWTHQNEE